MDDRRGHEADSRIRDGHQPGEGSCSSENPKAAEWARAAGLAVTPYTYRASAVKGYADVTAEMAHDLKTYQLDGLITDNPDKAPK